MSKENVKKFYETLKADKALAEELQSAVKAANAETTEQAMAVILPFAAKKGLAFTAEEAVEFETEARELSEGELDKVNAAGWGFCYIIGAGAGGGCFFVGGIKEGVRCVMQGGWK